VRFREKLEPADGDGWPTGETLYNQVPRSFLAVGNFGEFVRGGGVNQRQRRLFELYRRNTWRPEIITFDYANAPSSSSATLATKRPDQVQVQQAVPRSN
jgi:hypothetical protein